MMLDYGLLGPVSSVFYLFTYVWISFKLGQSAYGGIFYYVLLPPPWTVSPSVSLKPSWLLTGPGRVSHETVSLLTEFTHSVLVLEFNLPTVCPRILLLNFLLLLSKQCLPQKKILGLMEFGQSEAVQDLSRTSPLWCAQLLGHQLI